MYQISFLYGTCVGSSGERDTNFFFAREGGMSMGQKRMNSAAKEHVHLENELLH